MFDVFTCISFFVSFAFLCSVSLLGCSFVCKEVKFRVNFFSSTQFLKLPSQSTHNKELDIILNLSAKLFPFVSFLLIL